MKKVILPIVFFLLILISFSFVYAADWNPTGDISGRGIYKVYNITNLTINRNICFQRVGGLVCFNESNFSASSGGNPFNQSLNTDDNVRFNNVTANNFLGSLNWSWILNIPSYVKDWASDIAIVNVSLNTRINAVNSSLQSEISLQSSNNATQASLINNRVVINSDADIILNWSKLQNYPIGCYDIGGFLVNLSDSNVCVIPTGDAYITYSQYGFLFNETKLNQTIDAREIVGNASGGFSNNSDATIRDLNVSRLAVVNGSAVCTAANGLCSGSSYSAGLGLNLSGSVFNVNLSYFLGLFYLQNDTDWRVGLLQTNITNASLRSDSDNSTQASLINSLFSANNTHSLDNATQGALINSLFLANNTHSSDNATQGALINSLFSANATLVADNSTQASLINQRLANGSTANLSTLRVENNVSLGNSLNFTSIGSCIYGVGGSLCFNGTGVVIS